jgi:lipopolysaccharide/colanic/teichoic acid biosynthesis glycosyltransferase
MSLSEIPGAFTPDRYDVPTAGIGQISTICRFHTVPVSQLVVHDLTPTPASSWSVSWAKRVLDIFAASLALIAFSPMILFAALIVRLTSAGPILFSQKRVGRFGKLFTIYKFRSMRVEDGEFWPGHTKHRDPRLTAVGAWLRKYKLDELPQLVNVLLGDMSLVGPRPKIPGHESIYMSYRPGITSPATLAFRREEEMLEYVPHNELDSFYSARIKPVKHELDSEYMAQATFSNDLLMLVHTVFACLLPQRSETALARSEQHVPVLDESAD